MKIKKGDTIIVTTGKDKTRQGKVDRVYPKTERVLVENINLYKKHVQKSKETPQGGIVEIPRPLPVSNIMLICKKCKKPGRTKYEVKDGKKIRICKKCGKEN